jgi:hypothetical protein
LSLFSNALFNLIIETWLFKVSNEHHTQHHTGQTDDERTKKQKYFFMLLRV